MPAQPDRVSAIDPRILSLELVRRERLTPHMVRATLGGDDVDALTVQGYDQWFRFFFRREGQESFQVPGSVDHWWPKYLLIPAAHRPQLRNYTIRSVRKDAREIDVDFVVHENPGPGAAWALDAPLGDWVAILDQGTIFNPSVIAGGSVLIVGDESALPGIAGTCESLAADARGDVFLEVESDDEVQELSAPDAVRMHWLTRGTARVGEPLAAAIREWQPNEMPSYAYVCGESKLTTSIRRHLVRERGMQRKQVTFCGYWRSGEPVYDL